MSGIQFQTREEFEEAVRGVLEKEMGAIFRTLNKSISNSIQPFIGTTEEDLLNLLSHHSQPVEWFNNIIFFYRNESCFLKKFPDEFVAVHNGEVIGHGYEMGKLVGELYKEFGNIPLFVHKPGDRSIDTLNFPLMESLQ